MQSPSGASIHHAYRQLMDQDEFPVGTTVKYKCSLGDYGRVLSRAYKTLSGQALKTTAHVTTVLQGFPLSLSGLRITLY